jgi:hypothetical protein
VKAMDKIYEVGFTYTELEAAREYCRQIAGSPDTISKNEFVKLIYK